MTLLHYTELLTVFQMRCFLHTFYLECLEFSSSKPNGYSSSIYCSKVTRQGSSGKIYLYK